MKMVPEGALGFVALRNIGETDAKLQRLGASLKIEFGGPLAFLQMMTGINEGLEKKGDALLLVMPGGGDEQQSEFSLWLPIADYDRFLTSLGGVTGGDVTAITVAGEDLLVTKHESWAVLFDPDERERIPQVLKAEARSPQQLSALQSWLDTTDVAAVLLPGGVRATLRWASAKGSEAAAAPAVQDVAEDLFGPAEAADDTDGQSQGDQVSADFASQARTALRDVLSSSPKLVEWVTQTNAVGLGLQLDDNGNALGGLRILLNAESQQNEKGAISHAQPLPSLYDAGEFVLNGAGELPPPLSTVIAQVYARLMVRDLKTEAKLRLDSAALRRFQEAVEQAAGDVRSFAVLTKPGGEQEGVYTNSFLAVRVASAEEFIDHASEVMRLWNEMNREAERGTRLVFDLDEMKVADREATLYSIDIAAADGAAELPEVRQAMEKLFGPGGKFQLLVVRVDDSTVLLAVATPQQTAAMVETIAQKRPVNWAVGATSRTNQLLAAESQWRLFFSPHGYTSWLARQMEAITGPVLGGPIVKRFPPSPPIGAAGGMNADGGLWVDFVVPAQTIQNTPDYRKRPGVQLQR